MRNIVVSGGKLFIICAVAAILLGIFNWHQGLLSKNLYYSRDLRYILLGGVALVTNWVFLFQSFKLSSITIGIVSYYTAPFFLILLGSLVLKERISRISILWTFSAFGGLFLMSSAGDISIMSNSMLLKGVLFGLAAALLYATVIIMGKQIQRTPIGLVVFIQMLIGLILLFPLTNLSDVFTGKTQWGYLISLGAIHTAFLYMLFYKAVQGVPVIILAPLAFIDPVVAIISDVTIYSATISSLQLVGIAIIFLSSYMVNRSRSKGPQPSMREQM